MSKIHVYTIAYNEEIMLPQFINYYRDRFPNCNITVYDNESTDNTVSIAEENNCEVISWTSNNTIRDDLYLQIKNNCWKDSQSEWVIVVDCDEFIDITSDFLDLLPCNIIKTEGWDMIGDSLNINDINEGIRSPGYDKAVMFKPREIKEINYEPGCHNEKPESYGDITVHYNSIKIKLHHYKWLKLDYVIQRYQEFNKRLSDINKKYQWGIHYSFSPEHLTDFYNTALKNKIKVK